MISLVTLLLTFDFKRITLISRLFIGQYAVFLYRYIKEWRKNPHLSFSCCLALLVPLNDLQDGLGGLEEANIVQNQLQSGNIEKPSIVSAEWNSGTIDIIFEEGEHHNKKMARILEETRQDTVYRDTRRQQGTQTELCSIPATDILVHGSKADSD